MCLWSLLAAFGQLVVNTGKSSDQTEHVEQPNAVTSNHLSSRSPLISPLAALARLLARSAARATLATLATTRSEVPNHET